MDTVNREPILFGDYRNALTEDPRLYEDIVDYEAAKAIFDEVGNLLLSCTSLSFSCTACYCHYILYFTSHCLKFDFEKVFFLPSDSHTNTVISERFAYPASCRRKP